MARTQTTSAGRAAARLGVDLHLELAGSRVRAGLIDALREAVRSGRLAPGTRLPSSRALAEDLGIARSTVTECYGELIEEGWLVARHGSGTHVAERVEPTNRPTPAPTSSRHVQGLGPGAADYAEFPRKIWLAAARRALATAPHSAFGYGDPLGRIELRTALADYLSRARGVYAEPSQIVIASGFHHALGILARALRHVGTTAIAVEAYGLDIYRGVLEDEQLAIPPLNVDGRGARVAELLQLRDVGAVLLTPAHQFPTGHALSPERRSAAIDWARTTGGFILEDDYDGEFRYDRKPIGALQGLDPEHVVYFGTASKSVAPALRLAWAVVPPRLIAAVAEAKGRVDTVSVLDQLIFTEFVASGSFDSHVRSRRHGNRRRREELIAALAASAPEVRVVGMAAGLQTVLALPAGTEARAREAAALHDLEVSGLSQFRHPLADLSHEWGDALVVNFSAISDSAWPTALTSLCDVLSKLDKWSS